MIDFENKSYLKLKETDKNDFMDLIGGILVKGEEVVSCYRRPSQFCRSTGSRRSPWRRRE